MELGDKVLERIYSKQDLLKFRKRLYANRKSYLENEVKVDKNHPIYDYILHPSYDHEKILNELDKKIIIAQYIRKGMNFRDASCLAELVIKYDTSIKYRSIDIGNIHIGFLLSTVCYKDENRENYYLTPLFPKNYRR